MSASYHQQLLSNKAQEYFAHSRYYDQTLKDEIRLTLDQSDNILTLVHGFLPSTVECLMIEGLISLSLNKSLKMLWKIEYKEFENYLRDENHKPALREDKVFVETFSVIREHLILESLKQVLAHHSELIYPSRDSNLVAKNRWGLNFCLYLGQELILIDGGEITIKMNPQGMKEADISFLLQSISTSRTDWPMFKVVAVS